MLFLVKHSDILYVVVYLALLDGNHVWQATNNTCAI